MKLQVRPDYIPHGILEIERYYGKVESLGFIQNLSTLRFPLELKYLDGSPIKYAQVHNLIKPWLLMALEDLKTYSDERGIDLEKEGLNVWGGCYNKRKMTGNKKNWSTHAWGIAFDMNCARAPYGKKPDLPDWFVYIFERHGFEWGGRWKTPDGMHWQLCTGY